MFNFFVYTLWINLGKERRQLTQKVSFFVYIFVEISSHLVSYVSPCFYASFAKVFLHQGVGSVCTLGYQIVPTISLKSHIQYY